MDLGSKLNMIANSSSSFDYDEELAGVKPTRSETNTEKEDIDFGLGDLSIKSYLDDSGYKDKKSKKKSKSNKKYKSIFDSIDDDSKADDYAQATRKSVEKITNTTRKIAQSMDLASADDFDAFLEDEGLFSAEEDAEMRNNLVSLGRKYARDSASSKESSEINKTFADSERRLKALYDELDKDKNSLQKDIDRMRVPGRGGKTLADLIIAKNSMQSTQLSIVKEINSLRKNVFDLRQKEAARKDAENLGANDINSNTLQSIFSTSRANLINSMGGYSGVSGSGNNSDSAYDYIASDEMSDEEIHRRYFKDEPEESDDGSKFLQYEDRGVEYILLLDEDDKVQGVIAEDRDGNLVPDYPLPSNIDELSFDIDHVSNMATDNLQRNYHIRKV